MGGPLTAASRARRLASVGLLLVLVVACGPAGGVQPPPARPVVVPDTTKVTDDATRAALESYDPDTGVMRFSDVTGVLASLAPDDVLVSEPSAAAPYGYLRKVKEVRREGDDLVLETTQANLTDAVHQGELDASAELAPAELVSATAFVDGLTVGPASHIGPAVGVGDGFSFRAGFDEVVLDLHEGPVTAKVRVSGELFFNAGYHVGVGIEGCLELPPVCVDRFEAWIGVQQHAQLTVSGEASAKLSKEIKVAEYRFAPKCFAIGPVPVCIVPTVYVFVGASGEVNLRFRYAAVQTADARIGAKWTDDRGWEDIAPGPLFDTTFDQSFDVTAGLNAQTYLKAEGALMLYGITGPTIGAKLGLELDAKIPRDPFWVLRGSLEAYYGFIVDIPVIGRLAESNGTLYSLSREFGRSENSPPIIFVQRPDNRIDLGRPVELGFFFSNGACVGIYCVTDPEDGVPTVTLSSDRDGPLPTGRHVFATPGLRTVTVTATDKRNARSTATFRVDVVNTPPVAYGSAGSDTVQQTVPLFISAAASDPNSKLDCSALRWAAQAPDVVEAVVIGTDVCYGRAVFNVLGQRSVTLTAVDPQGAASPARTFSVFVTDPPPNLPPNVTRPLTVSGRYYPDPSSGQTATGPIPYGGRAVPSSNPLTLTVEAVDPERPADPNAITYAFSARCANCARKESVPLTNSGGTAQVPGPLSWYPGRLSDEFLTADIEAYFSVTVSDGTTPITLTWLVIVPFSSIR